MTSRRALSIAFSTAGLLAALVAAPSAQAAIPAIPDGAGGTIACSVQSGGNAGERHCSGIFTTFDGAPIDINVAFPPAPAAGPDGDFPIMGIFHGWGGSKSSNTAGDAQRFIDNGYAFFSMSDRGWGNSCGGLDPKRVQPVCAEGYNHLMDTRFEVRDAQEIWEALADAPATGALAGEGLIDPQRIGATGGSYGGGISMALGALRNRKMLPDDTLVPWVSDGGKAMEIAGVQPDIPWTDLAYSLAPNGATLDYTANNPYRGPNGDRRIGVLKQSFVSGLYGTGAATSNYAAPGTDPDADLHTWYSVTSGGEPYDSNPLANDVVEELQTHHSSYYIDHSVTPAPMLISNGWTDDLFPADEAIRFYNRTKTQYPAAHMALYFSDHGHQRGRGASQDSALRAAARNAWLDHFVKGTGPAPFEGVSTLPQVCNGANPSGTVISASSWAALPKGEVRGEFADLQTVSPSGGSPAAGQAYDPIAGGGACATADGDDLPSSANYRLPAASGGGYTLIGSPTVVADIYSPGINSQLAARLLDVDPDTGNATLIGRGLWRPKVSNANGPTDGTRQVFQLHPNRWHFADGHIAKVELLAADQPYGRNSNGQAAITIQSVEVRLPVNEAPGGAVQPQADKILPAGYELARDFTDPTDADLDGWPDDSDNCPQVANGTQLDSDGDGIGDACDDTDNDVDDDGIQDSADNCPVDSNPAQGDADGDGIGDVCDPENNDDLDEDGVANDEDNCPENANPSQLDDDGDGLGNACDSFDNRDADGDGVLDADDNCVSTPNPGQGDTDEDGVGDACDPLNDTDFDEDGVDNLTDNCVNDYNPGQADADSDGVGNACDDTNDVDGDEDGVLNEDDNCVATHNPGQADSDGDGIGNACDPVNDLDLDEDGVADAEDNCPEVPNPAQKDADSDGIGNACDEDSDNDGVVNADDECPVTAGDGADGCPRRSESPDGSGGSSGRCPRASAIAGTMGRDRLAGTLGSDRLYGLAGADVLIGRRGADCIWGQRGADRLHGGAGDDWLKGSAGSDLIKGGPGRDVMLGNLGDDVLLSRDGRRDLVYCGAGNDRVSADHRDRLFGCERVTRRGPGGGTKRRS